MSGGNTVTATGSECQFGGRPCCRPCFSQWMRADDAALASFGAEALIQASNAAQRDPRESRLNPRRAVPPGLLRRWRHRRRPVLTESVPGSTMNGRFQAIGAVPRGHLPLTMRASSG
jgi:hypothetical protein